MQHARAAHPRAGETCGRLSRRKAPTPPRSASPARSRAARPRLLRRRCRADSIARCGSSRSQPRRKPAHEGIARAENVVHLDVKTRSDDPVFDVIGHGSRKYDTALRAPLADDGCGCPRTHQLQSGNRVGGAAQNANFLFRSDHQIAQRQHILQPPRYALRALRSGFRRDLWRPLPRAPAGSRYRTRLCRPPP